MRTPAPKTFELGLVMAGAVSAGAYTAGVLDFLFEALECWEDAKRQTPAEVPDHTVQIRALAGTSAGGISAALAAMLPFTQHHPVRDLARAGAGQPANADKNLLYRSWVRAVDLLPMLATGDVKGDQVPALLNGAALDKIADDAIATVRAAGARGRCSYFANPLQLYLCVTNLRGVPYLINMVTDEGVRGHRAINHADYAHFGVFGTNAQDAEGLPHGASAVNWPGTANSPHDGWFRVREAALATSAFPVGLPARAFSNELRLYEARPWSRPAGVPLDMDPPRIAPDAPPHLMQPYQFWTVDGGVINNEPLEFARVALSGAPDVHNARDPLRADRAVLMIDPFPDDEGQILPEHGAGPDLVGTALGLLPTLKTHARFKPEEIVLALHEDVYSRYLIAPRRSGRSGAETDIASAGLGGFAGFIDEAFRRHDFQLGRRNCQKFLRDRLVVHRDNDVVREWTQAAAARPGGLDAYHPRYRNATGTVAPDKDYVQLIPLFGKAREDVPALPWPRVSWRTVKDRLEKPILARADAVAPALVRRTFGMLGLADKAVIGRLVRSIATSKIKSAVRDKALSAIEEDLKTRGLTA